MIMRASISTFARTSVRACPRVLASVKCALQRCIRQTFAVFMGPFGDNSDKSVIPFLLRHGTGEVLFTQPACPIKCGGAPQKVMWLQEAAFRQRGLRDQVSPLSRVDAMLLCVCSSVRA